MTIIFKDEGYIGMDLSMSEAGMGLNLHMFDEIEYKSKTGKSLIKISNSRSILDMFLQYVNPFIQNSGGFTISYIIANSKEDCTKDFIAENKQVLDCESIFLESVFNSFENLDTIIYVDDSEYNIKKDFISLINKFIIIQIESF